MSHARIYLTHCAAKKDEALKGTGRRVLDQVDVVAHGSRGYPSRAPSPSGPGTLRPAVTGRSSNLG